MDERRRATQEAVVVLNQTLERKLRDGGIPIIALEGRTKRLFSIWKKMRRQKISLDQVYDLIAVRVVTESVKDCYAALGIIHQTWAPVPGRFKDFVAMSRPNGYRSLHTSVVSDQGFPFEVQIRTQQMHRIAEEGIASHWKYEEGRVGTADDEQYFLWLRQLLERQHDVPDPSEFLSSLKLDLYPEEVYIFTPKGEVKALPRGATAVDFAYSVHTDIGHMCVGARVNGQMVPLRSQLKSGDIVEVVTAADHSPARDWLNFVTTTRARNRIKHFIHAKEKTRAVELGRKMLEKQIRHFDLKVKTVLDADVLESACIDFGAQEIDDLLALVGYGKVSTRTLLEKLVPVNQLREPKKGAAIASAVRRVLRPNQHKIKVRGFDDLMVFRAGCCNPIRGEKIVGYVTRGKGVSVHSASCRNVTNLFYDPDRRIDVVWDSSATDKTLFIVCLTIQVEDRRGMLADVTSRISNAKINIRKVEATAHEDQHGHISVTIGITDLKHLQRVIKVVRAVPGVLNVERVLRQQ